MTGRASEAGNGVRIERNVLIPLSDGVELAADLYLPAAAGRHPALISYYPYRKDDIIGAACEDARQYFAACGYASLLVDFRGTGGSSGTCTDTFDTVREGRDGAEVVEWAAAQEWCDGAVGMYGISYGGIMAMAVAAQQPPHLKAIAPIYGPPDVWSDWISPGGCPNCLGNYARESFMLALALAPPTFQDADGRWWRVWEERLAQLSSQGPSSLRWQAHPNYDEYWRQRAVPLGRIRVPSFFVGSWRDLFPEAVPASFEQVSAPKRLLMGPWLHVAPDASTERPTEWLPEVKRWWDRWLRGEENGVDHEPAVSIFVQGVNEWRHENEWPIRRAEVLVLQAGCDGTLGTESEGVEDLYEGDSTVGAAAGLGDPLGTGVGYPLEQSEDESRSLCYTTEPLAEATEITGSPVAIVQLTVVRGTELVAAVKLSAVDPRGRSSLITSGWLDAAYRAGFGARQPVHPGDHYELRVPMWATSYLVPAGHRLRLSIACADFPRVWPSSSNPLIAVAVGGSATTAVSLPVVRGASRAPANANALADADPRTPPWIVDAKPRWTIERDPIAEAVTVTLGMDASLRLPAGAGCRFYHDAVATVSRERPDAARINASAGMDIRLAGGERVEVETRSRFTRKTMLLEGRVSVDGRILYQQRWTHRAPGGEEMHDRL